MKISLVIAIVDSLMLSELAFVCRYFKDFNLVFSSIAIAIVVGLKLDLTISNVPSVL